MTLDDLRVAVDRARRATAQDPELAQDDDCVPLSYVAALADCALEYLDAEREFGEASSAMMMTRKGKAKGKDGVDFGLHARRVAVAEVALRLIASAGRPAALAVPPSATPADVDPVAGRRPVKGWWGRLWTRLRPVPVRSGGDFTHDVHAGRDEALVR